MRIADIVFGLSAAEEERSSDPRLLLEGYFDAFNYTDQIAKGQKFLILGSKGSGKSAIASRIELTSKGKGSFFSTTYQLGSFPFDAFSELIPGGDAPQIKFPSNWELLLHVLLLESLGRDEKCEGSGEPSLARVVDALKKLGLIPGKDLTHLVRTTSSRQTKLSIPHIFEFKRDSESEEVPDIKFLFRVLQDVACRSRPSARHFIFIDGLDDVLTRRGRQYEALAALLVAADRMNRRLRDSGVSAKIVILCRTDLFDLLPDPNKNKIRQDNAVILDWYQDTRDVNSTSLVQLVNLRALCCLGKPVDVFKTFLPSTIIGGQPTVKTLLDNTRHTPRDFIQLLNRIRDSTRGASPTVPSVLSALRTYSFDYLLPEIRDEMCGLVPAPDADHALQALGILGKRQFTFDEFLTVLQKDSRFKHMDGMKTLEQLFECSAIGNIRGGEEDDDFRYSFRFRNRGAVFNPNERIVIHRGLVKALNVN